MAEHIAADVLVDLHGVVRKVLIGTARRHLERDRLLGERPHDLQSFSFDILQVKLRPHDRTEAAQSEHLFQLAGDFLVRSAV